MLIFYNNAVFIQYFIFPIYFYSLLQRVSLIFFCLRYGFWEIKRYGLSTFLRLKTKDNIAQHHQKEQVKTQKKINFKQ